MIALRPQYWEMYKDGSKIWELRKITHSPKCVDGLVVYATAPVSRIVGEVDLVSCYSAYVNDLWDTVKDGCGITRKQYDRYYQGHDIARAYRLGNVWEYTPSIPPLLHFQGFFYLLQGRYEDMLTRTERRLVHAAR
jgi:predicted transcriptional regulator